MRAKSIVAGLVFAAMLIAAECVRAAVSDRNVHGIGEAASRNALVAAELDPVFVQKLLDRARRPSEHSQRSIAPAR